MVSLERQRLSFVCFLKTWDKIGDVYLVWAEERKKLEMNTCIYRSSSTHH